MAVNRGTGDTITFSRYDSELERELAQRDYEFAGNSSDAALGRIWAGSQIAAETCYQAQNKTGNLIGTSFVARDMMQIVDALGEDGMLRYWGEWPVLQFQLGDKLKLSVS